ncbi:hypothetical protein CHS0354_033481 [Potamilus streckersoni]|uniref:Uncharacterized protein n=1 Tax=Potamilus streckersoni TaxID=2493646 RepID=A0AAE0T6B0_9BIVA|nr:hypothetical protein CHS0354_033481 [Potamilus streckersoni]
MPKSGLKVAFQGFSNKLDIEKIHVCSHSKSLILCKAGKKTQLAAISIAEVPSERNGDASNQVIYNF